MTALRALVLAVLLFCVPAMAFGAPGAVPPTTTSSSSAGLDLTPRTHLEHYYYEAAVSYRRKWKDALSAVKSSTTSLQARNPESMAAFATSHCDKETSDPTALYIGIGAVGAVLGGIAVWFVRR